MKKNYTKNLIASLIATGLSLPSAFVNASEPHDMQEAEHIHDHGDNPIIAKVMIDQLEIRDTDSANSSVMEVQAWIGKDINKLWLKADVEKRTGETEDAELQALFSHAIAPYWDLQMGLRKDITPSPSRTWAVLGVQGLAPYFFDIDTALFVGDSGRMAIRISAEYELMFTQKLILSPNVDVNFYGQNDAATATGSGLSDATAGLRLRYEICREFAPYVGVHWNQKFGAAANFARAANESVSNTEAVVGLRLWF